MIKPDPLGTLGEQKFGGWCAEEELTFSKSTWDRAGWDFILDFEMPTERETLDRRPGAHTCRVQVKTIGHTKNRVRLRLDMAERLAKDPGPSFVVGIRIDDANQVVALHVLPMSDDRLAAVLKRLRKASLDNTGPISKKFITFPLGRATRIEASGRAMKSAFLNHVGPSLQAYILRKRDQLSTLGFEERPIGGTFTISPTLQGDLERMFLGLEGRVAVDSMEITETRFGLTEVTSEAHSALISVKPQPFDTCTITVRPLGGSPLTFEGDIYLTPPGLEKRLRVQLKLFDLTASVAHSNQIHFSFDLTNKAAAPNEWLKLWLALRALKECGTLVELVATTQPLRTEMWPDGLAADLDLDGLEWACEMAGVLERIAQRAAWPPTVEISWQHVLDIKRWLDLIDRLTSGVLTSWRYWATSDVMLPPSLPVEAVFVCYVPVDKHLLVSSATTTMACASSDGRITVTLENIQSRHAAVLASHQELDAFVERFKTREGLTYQCVIGPGSETEDPSADTLPLGKNGQ
ncbi:hypothetical protein [Rhodanobacter sp. DHG33]|uniref:hypothetical protein n=1 Tax=Rhodanobacter sp. DHG33 TaxID=2775921 RepID=UPI0017817F25|nr:hypothetical protein [Rhodanobacter sp. DHG33]MBD8898577.1 hypothetical protein [Rhodanobacter sp. DHG33]